MRTLSRTHGVSVAWLHERFTTDPSVRLTYQETKGQSADILTKCLDPVTWARERRMLGICGPKDLPDPLRDPPSEAVSALAVSRFAWIPLANSMRERERASFILARPLARSRL